MGHVFARAAAAALAAALALAAAAAEPSALGPEPSEAFKGFEAAAEQVRRARAALAALEAGDAAPEAGDAAPEAGDAAPEAGEAAPKVPAWAGAAGGFDAAVAALRRWAGPALPDPAAFGPAPAEQLKTCATRPAALARVERQLQAAQAAAQRGAEVRSALRARLEAASAVERVRREAVQAAARVAAGPRAEELPDGWRDLEAAAKPIADLAAELRRQQERVDRVQAELRTRAAALGSQRSTYGAARDCLLDGSWVGSTSLAGAVAGLTLRLTGANGTFTGSANVGGEDVAVRSVSLSGGGFTIGLADGRTSLKGTLAADGKSCRGALSSLEGPGTFTLRKQ